MSIAITESLPTRRAYDAAHKESDERSAPVDYLREEFLKACAQCQADALAVFAGRVRDWEHGGTRFPTVSEIVQDEMQYRNFGERAVQILLMAAAGCAPKQEAQGLLNEMAIHFASMEAV